MASKSEQTRQIVAEVALRMFREIGFEKTTMRAIAGVLQVRYRALADGEFNHTSVLVLLDAEGRVLARSETMGPRPDPEFLAAVRKAVAI